MIPCNHQLRPPSITGGGQARHQPSDARTAGDIALAILFGERQEVWGSALQLGINFCGLAIAGSVTLLILRSMPRRKALRRQSER